MSRGMNTCLRHIFALACFIFASSAVRAEDKVVNFADDDPVMNAAIQKARVGLPAFWQRLAAHPENESGFALKVRVSDANGNEHFWCNAIDTSGAKPTCAIDNEPQIVRNVTYGERIKVEDEQISDWMYMLDGKIKGGETIRVIIPKLSKEEQDAYRSMLADP